MNIKTYFLRQIVCTFVVVLLLGLNAVYSAKPGFDLTQAQAIARVRSILRNSKSGCRITATQSVSAARVRAGWRVTARIRMSASGRSVSETAVWIVSAKNGATAQNQLTAEIANGCP